MRTNLKSIKNFFVENGTVATAVNKVVFPKGTKFKFENISETSTGRQLFCDAKVVMVDKYYVVFDRNCIEESYRIGDKKNETKWTKTKENRVKLSALTDDQLNLIIKNLKS